MRSSWTTTRSGACDGQTQASPAEPWLGLAASFPPVPAVALAAQVSVRQITNVGTRICQVCARKAPVLSFRFVERDVEVAACPRCDQLTPKAWVPKETP